jgi:hypothetical protein
MEATLNIFTCSSLQLDMAVWWCGCNTLLLEKLVLVQLAERVQLYLLRNTECITVLTCACHYSLFSARWILFTSSIVACVFKIQLNITCSPIYILVEWLTLLLFIWKVPYSGPETGYLDWDFLWSSSVHPGKCWNGTFNSDTTASFHILPVHHSPLILSFDAI